MSGSRTLLDSIAGVDMRLNLLAFGLCFSLLLATPALAAWPYLPDVNLPVCTATGSQAHSVSTTDGAGGILVAWQDARSGNDDIYVQHVLASGTVDPAWPANGRAVCTAVNSQAGPVIVPDGEGGAIVAWPDFRSGGWDVYAQHIRSTGTVDPGWPVDGRALCTAVGSQRGLLIAGDGSGGALVAWGDDRNGSGEIYMQHVLSIGLLDPSWPVDGRDLCTAPGDQTQPAIVSDGAGGALVAWADHRSGAWDVYAQHVRPWGELDPSWPIGGLAVCTAASTQSGIEIASDGAGGAIVAWHDWRSGTYTDVYAQHVLATGTVDGVWPVDGRALCTAPGSQNDPVIVGDGAGGAIVGWSDNRTGSLDAYAQRVLASGVVSGDWPLDGLALTTVYQYQGVMAGLEDGANGAYFAWSDLRDSTLRVYVGHVLAEGVMEAGWPVDGRTACTGDSAQSGSSIVADGAGGVIVTWCDSRNGIGDVFSQRIGRFGYLGTPEAEISSVLDVPADQGGVVDLAWNGSWLDATSDPDLVAYDVLRAGSASPAADAWEYLGTVDAQHDVPTYHFLASTGQDSTSAGTSTYAFQVVARNADGSLTWPSTTVSGYSVDNLAPATPTPFTGQYAAGETRMHWDPNAEADLTGYRLYRGTNPGFAPDEGSLVAALADTGYVDTPGRAYVYKLVAEDVHGNLSPVAMLVPHEVLGVDGTPAPRAFLALGGPNPSQGGTVLRFGLATAGRANLAVYDAAGRRVRTLVAGAVAAGEHVASWDGRDEAGRAVAAGLYFARLEAPGDTRTVRLVRAK